MTQLAVSVEDRDQLAVAVVIVAVATDCAEGRDSTAPPPGSDDGHIVNEDLDVLRVGDH